MGWRSAAPLVACGDAQHTVTRAHLDQGFVLHKKTKRKISFADVVKFKGSPVHVHGYYKSAEKSHDASVSAQICEVHVDP